MSHSDVAPIEDHRGALRPSHVARMEVAVDERVGHAARVEVVEDRREAARRRRRGRVACRGRAACDHVGREVEERRTTPVGRAEREQLVLTADPLDLQGDERVEHRLELVALGFVAVVAGDVGEQHPSRLAGDESRHSCVVAERAQHRGLVREERWHVLQPHEPVVSGDLPDRRQVPRPDLHGRAGDRHVARCPREIRGGATRTRVGQPQGIVGERLLPWREQRRPRRRA